jgi:outer membrane receptor for ferrienterochelin and colicin
MAATAGSLLLPGATLLSGPAPATSARELPADQVEGSMKALEPADILKIEVQKNEPAVTRYGDRAKGGVILITTKRR